MKLMPFHLDSRLWILDNGKKSIINNLSSKILRRRRLGFTLIELIFAMAILGILASVVIIAVNPLKRIQQARDARRKADIKQFSIILQGFLTSDSFKEENWCDSSVGSYTTACNQAVLNPPYQWKNLVANDLYDVLINQARYVKTLPVDPINNRTYHYTLEVYPTDSKKNVSCGGSGICQFYWIGARLEAPADPTKAIFRCSNVTDLPNGAGCMEIAQGNSNGIDNDDPDCTEEDGDCW